MLQASVELKNVTAAHGEMGLPKEGMFYVGPPKRLGGAQFLKQKILFQSKFFVFRQNKNRRRVRLAQNG
jgi:hypothetical protein